MRENREISRLPEGDDSSGRMGKASGRNPMMYGREKSDRPVVPANHRNKAPFGAADGGEERGLTKGNSDWQNAHRTQRRGSALSALDRVRQASCGLASQPEVGAQCGSSARWDLCGGRPVWAVPTATCAGINRHGAGDESSPQERSSNPSWPRVMRYRPRGQPVRPVGSGPKR